VKNSQSVTSLVLNFGMQPAEADVLIGEGKIDAASFGRPWIANPDLQKRIEAGVPLETKLDYFGFYNFTDDMRVGYTDYPTAT
jgi:2,4-dienoyl-CoA reductase-like NADH-dependent reductase (Old Yellow Enzyme family)